VTVDDKTGAVLEAYTWLTGRTAPPPLSRSAATHSGRRIGWAMAVPSAMVGRAASAGRPRAARAMGPQFSGCAAKMRGRRAICPARSNSPKPIWRPSTLDPAPHGTMTLSGARKPRSSHSS